ncbi:MAG: sulfite exporter TauE/SafE family protein [Flavobacteriales bacterium]|nr:sulfite exporter TauE/SafE family protein [Flavobacteriales bacterium]
MNPLLATGFVLGIAGSAHCIGMCGPIALAVPSSGKGPLARGSSTVVLNSGRLVTYALIGATFGWFGWGARLAGLQQGISIAAGLVLLLTVILPGIIERWLPTGRMALLLSRLRGTLARNLKRTAPEALFLTGLLNGALPCGLVYSAAIGSAAMGSTAESILFMVAFGLGTWPALIALRTGGGLLGGHARQYLRRLSPVLVSVAGCLLILRGLELGIPLISPPPQLVPAVLTTCH